MFFTILGQEDEIVIAQYKNLNNKYVLQQLDLSLNVFNEQNIDGEI